MIYTSRYSNPVLAGDKYVVVGITRGAPKFPLKYRLAGNIIEIAPPGYLFNEYDRARFTPKYFQHLDHIGVPTITRLLNAYEQQGKDTVLCCYEDVRIENEWCHRLVFAEWWELNTGNVIKELEDTSQIKGKPRTDLEPQETVTQLSLFDLK